MFRPCASHHHHHHHHQVLLLLVEHRVSMKSFQALRSPAIPWPHSMIFLFLLFHPLMSFATFSSAYLFFYIHENSNLMLFSLLRLLLCVMCVQSNSIFFFLSDFLLASVGWLSIARRLLSDPSILYSLFVFIINLQYLLVIWLVVFQVSQAYSNTDFIFVLNICILTLFDIGIVVSPHRIQLHKYTICFLNFICYIFLCSSVLWHHTSQVYKGSDFFNFCVL